MKLYGEVKELKLTVSEMLSLQLALSDAERYNREKDFPMHARECEALLKKIRGQTDAWIDAADKEIQAENWKLKEAAE